MQGDPRLPKNRGQLRELLGDVMVRHTRSQVNLKLPTRQANTIRLCFLSGYQQLCALDPVVSICIER